MNVLNILLQVNAKGTETIGRVQAALGNFAQTIGNRVALVQQFNREISNGDVAIRQWGAAIAAAVSGNALRSYMADAEQADRVQQKLLQALTRTGQTGAAKALAEQASQLQLVTRFTEEDATSVQRLLVTSGMSAKQTMGLTESVLDFAEATGQSAESAAALIARTYRGSEEELGRYNIALSKTGDRAANLGKALAGYAQGQARAAVVDKQAHAAKVQLGEATEDLGRALNSVMGPALAALVPVGERFAKGAASVIEVIRPAMPQIAGLLAGFTALAAGIYLSSGAFKVLLAVVNPLRSAFVALAQVDFSTLNQTVKELGVIQTFNMATWGQKAAVGLSLVGAAIAGWQLGNFFNKLEWGGLMIEDWVARGMNWFYRFGQGVAAAGQTAWVMLKYNFLEKLTEARITILEFVEFAASKLNKILPEKFRIPTEGVRGAIDAYKQELGQLVREEANAMAEIEASYQSDMKDRDWVDASIVADGKAALAGPKPQTAGGVPPPVKDPSLVESGIMEKMLALGDRQHAAYLAKLSIGEQIKANTESLLETERRIAALPKDNTNATLERTIALESRKLDLVKQGETLKEEQRKRASEAAENTAAANLATAEQRIAVIQANRFATQEQKQAAILPLLAQEQEAIKGLIEYYRQLIEGMPVDDPRRIDAQGRLDALRNQQNEVGAKQEAATPLTFGQGAGTGAVGFLDSIGSASKIAADGVTSTLNSALSSTSDLLYDVVSGATSMKDAWSKATMAIGQQFLRMMTDMVAKMIWRATVERALTALGVTTHVVGEQAKTAATTTGFFARMATKIKEALGDVYSGAVAAFKAMAGIPYVGPFLAVAAMAAAIAGGVALVGKIGHKDGGIISGPGTGTSDSIPAMISNGEGIIPAHRVQQYGPDFINSIIDGRYLGDRATAALADRGSSIQAASAPLAAGVGNGADPGTGRSSPASQFNFAFVDSTKTATRIKRGSQAETDIIEIGRANRWATWRRR